MRNQKGRGAEKVEAMLKGGGGHNKFWGSFKAPELDVLTILKGGGGAKRFAKKCYRLVGGGRKKF